MLRFEMFNSSCLQSKKKSHFRARSIFLAHSKLTIKRHTHTSAFAVKQKISNEHQQTLTSTQQIQCDDKNKMIYLSEEAEEKKREDEISNV